MEKSAVTEFFIEYITKNQINKEWISEKTGIALDKISEHYRMPLTAGEFLTLCAFLEVAPEEVIEYRKQKQCE